MYKILKNHEGRMGGDYEMMPNAQLTIMSTVRNHLFIVNEEDVCDETLRNAKHQQKPN